MLSELPPGLKSELEQLAEGRSRRGIGARSEMLSRYFRAGAGSAAAIRSADDALAYAFTRLPATYAAVSAALVALRAASPDFSPRTLIDAGAGPASATFAAAQHLDGLADIRLIDDNPHLRALGEALLASSDVMAVRGAAYRAGDLIAALRDAEPADLVIASYAIGELSPDRLDRAAEALWTATAAVLLVIEPGTPAGFERIRRLRAQLLARGAHAIAPCPHDAACPILAPDWCHFVQRLPRSRAHRQLKGAELSYEDEKFSYVALGRAAPKRIDARVLARPRIGKAGIAAKLCTADGLLNEVTPRRERARYKARTRWRWGDAVDRSDDG
jgi:ribosomal protein RSM22 (predicted rRNA methylase)